MHRLFVAAQGLSLVVASRVYFLVAVHGYLIVSASLAEQHRLQDAQVSAVAAVLSVVTAHGLRSISLVVVMHGLSCLAACGILADQGSNWCPLHCKVDS